MAARSFDRPRGTRDLYPEDYLQRRYITETWRRVALRHGFDEIDGPTFEHLDLYTVKSGEGIVSELFSFSRAGGDETYALRPEYTPTLARQYAARAGQLPKPTRWFSIGPYFRAERPQRGRLREFLQWNVDVLSGDELGADTDTLDLMISTLSSLGFAPDQIKVHFSDRSIVQKFLRRVGVPTAKMEDVFRLLDKRGKLDDGDWKREAKSLGLDTVAFERYCKLASKAVRDRAEGPLLQRHTQLQRPITREDLEEASQSSKSGSDFLTELDRVEERNPNEWEEVKVSEITYSVEYLNSLVDQLKVARIQDWIKPDFSIVRGLAYYTGLVFEMRAEGERAVAGGGRYDKLIELLGGPPTPAVGFAMGDVVLANLLEDKGLMPKGKDLLVALSQPIPTRPDVFVIAGPDAQEDAILSTCATLRRGVDRDGQREPWHPDRYEVQPLHTRRSYKATRNVGKLLKEAASASARFAVIVESDAQATVKDLDSGEQWSDKVALDDLAARLAAAL